MIFPELGSLEDDSPTLLYWKGSTLWALSETMPVEHIPLEHFAWASDNVECNLLSEQAAA